MKYMLDTNICIYAIKNKPKEVIKHILSHKSDELCISAISYGELMHGVEKSTYREKKLSCALSVFIINYNFTI